jgi:putative oxidoreductase
VALLCLRLTLAAVFLMRAWNHVFGGGRIAGTARWFESLGMCSGVPGRQPHRTLIPRQCDQR